MPEGAFVVEYVGEVTTDAECAARRAAAFARGDATVYYMALTPGVSIDARAKGSLARLINSSCAPNCVAQVWTDAASGEPRVGIFTSRPVAAGEELAYDYAFEAAPEGEPDVHDAYACRCGAPACRGSLRVAAPVGAAPRDRGRRLSLGPAADRRTGVVVGYDTRKRLHTVAVDGGGGAVTLDLRTVEHAWADGGDDGGPPKPRAHAAAATGGKRDRTRENEARRAKRAAARLSAAGSKVSRSGNERGKRVPSPTTTTIHPHDEEKL
jgi:hypothetical protein